VGGLQDALAFGVQLLRVAVMDGRGGHQADPGVAVLVVTEDGAIKHLAKAASTLSKARVRANRFREALRERNVHHLVISGCASARPCTWSQTASRQRSHVAGAAN
jgi:hypothetical protein